VRAAAVAALQNASPAIRGDLLPPLYDDPSRLVRIEVARALAGATGDPPRAARASDELLAELRYNADRPEAQLGRGNFSAARGDRLGALAAFRKALAIDPGFSEAAVNLADLHRAAGDEAQAEQVLRSAIARDPSSAGAHHALGLVLVRQRRLPEALGELARAAALEPEDARFAYVHAVALHDGGKPADGLRAAEAALSRHPWDRDLLLAAASWRAEAGDTAQALSLARRLLELDPANADVQSLVRSLEAR
jgi:tetratricopeptide (TPR) repeat protein